MDGVHTIDTHVHKAGRQSAGAVSVPVMLIHFSQSAISDVFLHDDMGATFAEEILEDMIAFGCACITHALTASQWASQSHRNACNVVGMFAYVCVCVCNALPLH